jgi:hypothetical protein
MFAAGWLVGSILTREDRLIAALQRADAGVLQTAAPDGTRSYAIYLRNCEDNSVLPLVCPLRGVTHLYLAPAPLDETGMRCVGRLRELVFIEATGAGISDDTIRELKRRNPNLGVFKDGKYWKGARKEQ